MAFKDTLIKVKGHVPDWIYEQLPDIIPLGVDGPKRMSHILGQCKHESGNYKKMAESLYYTDATRLAKIFRSTFDLDKDKVIEPQEIEFAKKYLRNSVATANYVYANKNGNGNEASGDGYKFRGQGPLQTTGRYNVERLFKFLGLPVDTDPAHLQKDLAMKSAAGFFHLNSLWDECDRGVTLLDVKAVTRVINPALLELEQRFKYTQEFYNILTK